MPGPLEPDDPTSLGGYTLLGRLGAGGMGVVYLGRDASGAQAAVKVINGELLRRADQGHIARFRREIGALRRLGRRCTAQLIDADPDGEPPYLVTEFIPGPTLSEEIDGNGPLSGGPLESLAVGVLAALDHIHRAGVTHRDLKPGNIVLGPYGPRVIDFGLALLTEVNTQVTATGLILGTPAYMAPEQVTGHPVDAPADLFSWAGTVVFAATGSPPFGTDMRGMGDRIAHGTPRLDGLDGRLLEVVRRALAKDPADRPSAAEALDALRGLSMTRTVLDHASLSEVDVHRVTSRQKLGESTLNDLRRAHESDPSDSDVALAFARELAQSPLRSDVNRAYEMAPRDPAVRQARAMLLLLEGDEGVEEAYALAPDAPAVRSEYANKLVREGRDLALAYELAPDVSTVREAYARNLADDDATVVEAFVLAPDVPEVRRRYESYSTKLAGAVIEDPEALRVVAEFSEVFPVRRNRRLPDRPLDLAAASSAFDALEPRWRSLPTATRTKLSARAHRHVHRGILENARSGYPAPDSQALVTLIGRMDALGMGPDLRKTLYESGEGPLFTVLGILAATAGAVAYPLLALFTDLGFLRSLVVVPVVVLVVVLCVLAGALRRALRRSARRRTTESAARTLSAS